MLTHVVCFQFADQDTAREARERLLAMRGRVPALLDIECGLDITRSPRSHDLALITRHADGAGLAAYGADPVHGEVLVWIKKHAKNVVAVDFLSE